MRQANIYQITFAGSILGHVSSPERAIEQVQKASKSRTVYIRDEKQEALNRKINAEDAVAALNKAVTPLVFWAGHDDEIGNDDFIYIIERVPFQGETTPHKMYPVKSVLTAINKQKDHCYNVLSNILDCGPFDGGCVVVAMIIQRLCGGNIFVLTREDNTADHACVYLDGRLIDFENALEPEAFLVRFNETEQACTTAFRQMQKEDLSGAKRDALVLNLILPALINELEKKGA